MKAKLNNNGHEVLDSTPLALPLGFKKPESLDDQIRRLVRTHISAQAQEQGFETWEDADDFDIPDDQADPATPFEMDFDPILGREISPDMIKQDPVRFRDQYVQAAADNPATDEAIDRQSRRFRWPWQKGERHSPHAKQSSARSAPARSQEHADRQNAEGDPAKSTST